MKLEVERIYEVWQGVDWHSGKTAIDKSYKTLDEARARANELMSKGAFKVSIYIKDYPVKNDKDNYIIGNTL